MWVLREHSAASSFVATYGRHRRPELRYAIVLEEATDHVDWMRHASKQRHHIQLEEARERCTDGYVNRPF